MRLFLFFFSIPILCPAAVSYQHFERGFEENLGQTNPEVKFLRRGDRFVLFLTQGEAVFTGTGGASPLRIRFARGTYSQLSGEKRLQGRINYLTGGNSTAWHGKVPTYARVRCKRVYPGIDILYRAGSGDLEYDFLLQAEADPLQIRLDIEGATKLELSAEGDLILRSPAGDLVQHKPVSFQEGPDGSKIPVETRYVILAHNEVGFATSPYNKTRPLVIDPVLSYASYLGGSGSSAGVGVALDSQGNTYVTGSTAALDFPVKGGAQFKLTGNTDVFVSKVNPSGSALIYSTFLGGSARDVPAGIAVDAKGQAYITGTTWSGDFPVRGAFQPALGGSSDAFVAMLSADGSALVFSSYLGGAGAEAGYAIALDQAGHIDVAGMSESTNFPVLNALQPQPGGGIRDGFVSQFSAGGSLIFSTYLGGTSGDECHGITADAAGNIYVTGATWSSDFPLANPQQATYQGGLYSDAFLAKLNAAGTGLIYSTYLGGSGQDLGNAVAVDAQRNAYVAGETSSPDFPVVGALQRTLGGLGSEDAFLAKFSPDGTSLLYSTYLGGKGEDFATAIALDPGGSLLMTGETASADFSLSASLVTADPGFGDAFVASLSPSGAMNFATLLGGANSDVGLGLATDALGNAYVAGLTDSEDFPTFGAIQSTAAGYGDAFLAKISNPTASQMLSSVSGASFTPPLASGAIASGFGSAFTNSSQVAAGLPLPTSLGGVKVQITDSLSVQRLAPLFAVTPGQVNFLLPDGLAPGFAQATLIRVNGAQATGTIHIGAVAPALFSANENGKGVAAAIAVVDSGGSQTGFPIFSGGPVGSRTSVPVDLGTSSTKVYLELYGSGIRGRSSLSNVQLNIGGNTLPALYAGPSSYAGLDQVNVLLPASLSGRGDVDLAVTADGLTSNTVTVNIR